MQTIAHPTTTRHSLRDPIGGRGTWLQQVAECTAPGCPLFRVRPGADRGATAEKMAVTGPREVLP